MAQTPEEVIATIRARRAETRDVFADMPPAAYALDLVRDTFHSDADPRPSYEDRIADVKTVVDTYEAHEWTDW